MQNNKRAPYVVYNSSNQLTTQTAKKKTRKRKDEVIQPLERQQLSFEKKTSQKILTMKRNSASKYHFPREPTPTETAAKEAQKVDVNETICDLQSKLTHSYECTPAATQSDNEAKERTTEIQNKIVHSNDTSPN